MNDEKKIAQAILDAQTMREESYEEPKQPIDDVMQVGDDGIIIQVGEYKLDMEECLIRTCRQNGLSENLWCLLNLAMHWWNDIQLWADDVLAGKNILDECRHENAKMKDEMKQCPSGVVDEDAPCCDLASKDACEQCKETDSNGNLKGHRAAMDRVGEADESGLETDT